MRPDFSVEIEGLVGRYRSKPIGSLFLSNVLVRHILRSKNLRSKDCRIGREIAAVAFPKRLG